MKFKIIPDKQTPKVDNNRDTKEILKNDSQLIIKFLSFARRQYNCCGLAANQVSINGQRLNENFFVIKSGFYWDAIINPKILEYKGQSEFKQEYCLTWLGKTLWAIRFPEIYVDYYTLNGGHMVKEIDGFMAQVFQHEFDHLRGVNEKFA